jgi:glycopeptide antibiotics resistance protein
LLATAFVAYIVFLSFIALFLFPADHPPPNLAPFRTMADDWRHGGLPFLVNFVGNFVAFLPMGAAPRFLLGGRFWLRHATAFSLGLSLLIELSQFYSGRRVFDVDDLILNTLGGVVGYTLVAARRPSSKAGRFGGDPQGSSPFHEPTPTHDHKHSV